MKTIDDLVYGHARAKKVLQVLINRSKERHYKKCVKGEEVYPDRLNCLLIGQSGTGKTHLIKSMSKIHDFPLLCIDATELMPTGNDSGLNRNQLRKLIMDTAKEYTNKPQYHSVEGVLNQMVIFVDEFDKLGRSYDSSGNWNKQVQSSFLTMIEDTEELAGISWIFAGAFSGIYETRSEKKRHGIGFFEHHEESKPSQEIKEQDILKAGIIPEMLGRIPLIVQLDDFVLEDYINIVKQLLETKYNVLKSVNVEQIAEQAMSSGQGIRSITRQLEMALIDQEAETPWVMPTVF